MTISVLWTPAALPVAPGLFLDADLGVTASGGVVESWGNQGAIGGDFSNGASYRPALVTGELPVPGAVVRFAGGDSLVGSTAINPLLRNVAAGWMLLLIKRTGTDASATSRRVLMASTSSNNAARASIFWDDATGGTSENRLAIGGRRVDGEAYSRVQSSTTQGPGAWKIVLGEVLYSSRTLRLYINGVLDAENTSAFASAGNTSDTPSSQWTIGGTASGSSSWIGDMAMALAGAGTISTDDRQMLEGWAAHRYGLTALLPSGHPYEITPPVLGPVIYPAPGMRALDEIHGVDTLRVDVKRYINSESQLPQRARVSLMRMRDKHVFRRAWSDAGLASFPGVNAARDRYIALAEYPSNPDNPSAEEYLRPVAGVSLKRGES
jgi:hypothetical protein